MNGTCIWINSTYSSSRLWCSTALYIWQKCVISIQIHVGCMSFNYYDYYWCHAMMWTCVCQAPEFPEFTSKVLEAINALGGRVFPKLNWSAPRVKDCTQLFIKMKNSVCSLCCKIAEGQIKRFEKFVNITSPVLSSALKHKNYYL